MRNLAQYPITREEVVIALERLIADQPRGIDAPIGSPLPFILDKLHEFISVTDQQTVDAIFEL